MFLLCFDDMLMLKLLYLGLWLWMVVGCWDLLWWLFILLLTIMLEVLVLDDFGLSLIVRLPSLLSGIIANHRVVYFLLAHLVKLIKEILFGLFLLFLFLFLLLLLLLLFLLILFLMLIFLFLLFNLLLFLGAFQLIRSLLLFLLIISIFLLLLKILTMISLYIFLILWVMHRPYYSMGNSCFFIRLRISLLLLLFVSVDLLGFLFNMFIV